MPLEFPDNYQSPPAMVIGERFAWGHLQKTGGDATWELFRLFPDLVVFADPRNIEAKHASSPSAPTGARQAAGREHPAPALVDAQLGAAPGPLSKRPDGSPVPMNSPRQMVNVPRGDMRLAAADRRGSASRSSAGCAWSTWPRTSPTSSPS